MIVITTSGALAFGALVMLFLSTVIAPRLAAHSIRGRLTGTVSTFTVPSVAHSPSDEQFADFLEHWSRSCTAGASIRSGLLATLDSFPHFQGALADVIHRARRGGALTNIEYTALPTMWRRTIHLAAATHSPTVMLREARRLRQVAVHHREAHTQLATAQTTVRVLSWAPVALSCAMFALSGSARSFMLGTPAGLALLASGLLLQVVGRVWVSRLFTAPPRSDDARLIETLAAALAAGLTVAEAIAHLPQWHDDMKAGAAASRLDSGLHEALDELRSVSPDVTAAIDLLENAAHDGLPLAARLDEFADDLRNRRAESYRAHIRTMSVKANIPLVVCVLPSFVLLAMAPLAAILLSPLGSVIP